MSQRSLPAPFLTKTYQMVEDSSTNDVISWNESGTTFVVWCPAEFARDLLPRYFKHNNFSSFVRQLNTYGFRKIVPDRWEFANDFFRRGEKDLLCEIHRRKAAPSAPAATGKPNGRPSSVSNSGEEQGSSSTSSADPPPRASSDISDENERLRKDNLVLSSELAEAKKQCQELLGFLSKCVNVSPEKINSVMQKGEGKLSVEGLMGLCEREDHEEEDEEGEGERGGEDKEEEECLKLFGVWLRNSKEKKRKRGSGEEGDIRGPLMEMKMDFRLQAPWMKISSKVCN